MEFKITQIGQVVNQVGNRKDTGWGTDVSEIILDEKYIGGLEGLADFSHAVIVYYLDQANFDLNEHLQRRPQNREEMPLRGIFAQRGKDRPNQIGLTTVEIISVFEDRLIVKGLDAIADTPVLDIKPYYPMYDCREGAVVPEWVHQLMREYF